MDRLIAPKRLEFLFRAGWYNSCKSGVTNFGGKKAECRETFREVARLGFEDGV